jgi:splicing factor 3B subunit 3
LFSHLYQIARLGDNDDQPEFSSRVPLEEGETYFYDAHPLQNLILVDQMDNLSPIIKSKVSYFKIHEINPFLGC